MLRAVPILILLLAITACSKSPAKDAATTQPAAGSPALPGTPGEPAKPVPAQLPEVVARVNGEKVTRKELEDYVQNLE